MGERFGVSLSPPRDRRTSPEPGSAHEGGFGEDLCCGVLCPGTGWAWWHHLMIPGEAWWHHQPGLVASPRGLQPGLCLSAFHPHHPLLSRASLRHRRLQCPLCIARFGGCGQGLAVPQPRSVLGGAHAVFPGKEPLSQFGSVSMATALSFPQRFRRHRSGSGRWASTGLAPNRAGSRPCL